MSDTLSLIVEAVPFLLGGVGVTVVCVVGGMLTGLVLGVPMAVGQVYGGWVVRRLVGLYVWFFRGVPILVLLFLFYFGLFQWPHLPLMPDIEQSKQYGELHEIFANIMLALFFLHVGAVVKHQFINRENILARMLPLPEGKKI